MAVAYHDGGPVHGLTLRIEATPQVRFYLPAAERVVRGWLPLARYVFVPPRDGKHVRYRYTGVHQVMGPLPGAQSAPEWST
jgi:hypothetical protein